MSASPSAKGLGGGAEFMGQEGRADPSIQDDGSGEPVPAVFSLTVLELPRLSLTTKPREL